MSRKQTPTRAEWARRHTVPAREILPGQCFRIRVRPYVHLRIDPSAIRFWGQDDEYIFGVAYDGSAVKASPDDQVEPVPPIAMADDRIQYGDGIEEVMLVLKGDG